MEINKPLKVLSLCDGISCGLMAFNKLGVEVEYHAIEFDKKVRDLSDLNLKDIKRWEHDVNGVTVDDIKEHGPFDWVILGPPCQSVSTAGKRRGLEGKSGLIHRCIEILRWCQHYNPDLKYLIENVRMSNLFRDQFSKIIGHEPTNINSNLVSGQNRPRYYWTNVENVVQPEDKNIFLADIVEDYGNAVGWSKSTRYKDKTTGKVGSSPTINTESYIETRLSACTKSNTLNTGVGCRNQSTSNFILSNMLRPGYEPLYEKMNKNPLLEQALEKKEGSYFKKGHYYWRYLTVSECAKLQTIPASFDFSSVSTNQAYKAIGNGWTVDVIKHILHCDLSVFLQSEKEVHVG